ncbi:MAG: glycyl radical protein [Deltaproteobacteria bacterium]|jgi:formate C-acetyltransferase|nr:glycyl radical protein [Deltaproteobacteria bacterium]
MTHATPQPEADGRTVLSPQEARLAAARAGLAPPPAPARRRAAALIARSGGRRPRIDVGRALLFTESMRLTEGEPLNLRWAKALGHIAERLPVHVVEGQLLLGRCGAPGRHGILYPELDGDFLDLALAELPGREGSPADISPEDAETVIREIAPYWKGRTYHEALNRALPEDVRLLTYADREGLVSRFVVNETSSFRSSIQWVHDYEKVLRRGFRGLAEEARERLASLDPLSPADQASRRPFYEAAILVCESARTFALRHSEAAFRAAASETDPARRRELEDLAERASRVPWEPAGGFRDAVQSQWFVQVLSRLEQKTGTIVSNGRMDQYLWPYYRDDLERGLIDEDSALELLECLWVQLSEFVDLYISPAGGAFNEGYAHWEAVTIGGQTPDGRDAVNPLTSLFLRSKREFPLHYPDLAARVHGRSPRAYLLDIAETIKDGSGFPKLINDEEVVPLLVKKGAEFSEALDYAVSGCTEARMPNRDTYTSGGAYVNFAAALEMALRNGRLLRWPDLQLGPETGPAEGFRTWDDLWRGYLSQHLWLLRAAFIQQAVVNRLRALHFAQPLGSALHDLCMRHAVDLHQERVPGGLDFGYVEFIGYATVADSLSALRKRVFEEGRLTMAEVMEALDRDFEGREAVRALLRGAPRYGNDDPYADSIARELDRVSVEYAARYSRELGINNDVRYVPFTSHVPFGRSVSATPNGRKAFFPLSDGSSPSQGADENGPTSILLSNFNTKNMDLSARAARMLNIKFTPRCLEGREGSEKLAAFIRAFVDLKLWHVQFNVVNRETLLAAQRDPEGHRGLIVRIAGYSAYFTDLSRDLQDDLIARYGHDRL